MERYEIGLLEQLVQGRNLARGSQGHERDNVVVDDIHTHGFGENRELGANVSVSHNPCESTSARSRRQPNDCLRNSPSVLPRISQHFALTLFQVPRCISGGAVA